MSFSWTRANLTYSAVTARLWLNPTVKNGGGSVMTWRCIRGVGNLVFIDGIMSQDQNLKILKENFKQSVAQMGIGNTFKLYQDNDLKPKAHDVRSWLLYNCPKVLKTPPQSPDLISDLNSH